MAYTSLFEVIILASGWVMATAWHRMILSAFFVFYGLCTSVSTQFCEFLVNELSPRQQHIFSEQCCINLEYQEYKIIWLYRNCTRNEKNCLEEWFISYTPKNQIYQSNNHQFVMKMRFHTVHQSNFYMYQISCITWSFVRHELT